jgi:hypothetical protein
MATELKSFYKYNLNIRIVNEPKKQKGNENQKNIFFLAQQL